MDISEFIRDAGKCDGVLRGILCSHPNDTVQKSDGFIFALNCHVLLIDGGMKDSDVAYERMCALRESICPHGRLRVNWILSHYHVDHISTTIDRILPDTERFDFEEVYLPPVPKLHYKEGDSVYHRRALRALEAYAPKAIVHHMQFAAEGGYREVLDHAGARVIILPPDCDWSAPAEKDLIINGYFDGDKTCPKINTSIVNAASSWVKISYAGKKLLFTGDSMKRTATIADESFDRMLTLWADFCKKPDLIKWPHHGMVRDNAAAGVFSTQPKHVLTSTQIETASAFSAEHYPEDYKSARFHNCAETDVLFTVTPDGNLTFFD